MSGLKIKIHVRRGHEHAKKRVDHAAHESDHALGDRTASALVYNRTADTGNKPKNKNTPQPMEIPTVFLILTPLISL